MRMFDYEVNRKARDILSIAYGVFDLEKVLKNMNVKKVTIERFLKNYNDELIDLLSNLVSYVLLEDVDFKFVMSKAKLHTEKIENQKDESKIIVLFSGGIDSFSGIFWAKEYFKNIEGLFCAHSDQGWSIHIVNNIFTNFLNPANIQLKSIKVPPIHKGGYSQLRGFLYILSAGAYMSISNVDTLVISECGLTMYQPKFGIYDSVTMTTHPFVVGIASKVLELLLQREINIITPFEDMTKADVIACTKDYKHIGETHSCVSQRFGTHDGTCYGCIIRRLGSIVAGVSDVQYKRNPLIDETANDDNLISVLMFSIDFLTNSAKMPLYQIENIESFNKRNLFKRFALDNIAAVHLLAKQNIKLTRNVLNMYNNYLDQFSINDLEKRIEAVRNHNFKINLKPFKYQG